MVLVLGTAGLALSAARSDDDQGVFVGEGRSIPAAPTETTFTRVITDESAATTAEPSGTGATDSTGTTAGSPFPSDLLPVTRTVCVSDPVSEAVLADLAQAVGARFAAIGRTVQMRTWTPRTANFDVSCTSGQAILLS